MGLQGGGGLDLVLRHVLWMHVEVGNRGSQIDDGLGTQGAQEGGYDLQVVEVVEQSGVGDEEEAWLELVEGRNVRRHVHLPSAGSPPNLLVLL